MRHNRYIELTTKIADANPNRKWKHAAILVKAGRILSVGLNNSKHAEVSVFRSPKVRYTTGHLYVARVPLSTPGVASDSRPCDDCILWLLDHTNIRYVHYTVPAGHEILDLRKVSVDELTPRSRAS